MKKWEIIESQMAFESGWFNVRKDKVKLPNGKVLDDYYVWLRGDVSLIVPVTANNEFILVRQYKHGIGEIVTEYPAGFIDKRERPEVAARRELLEETGYGSDEVTLIATTCENPTKALGKTLIFLARNAHKMEDQKLDDTEDIEVFMKPWQEVLEMVRKGEIWITASIAATFLALEKLKLRG
jgi:ADP-ribose pyrophosphatase